VSVRGVDLKPISNPENTPVGKHVAQLCWHIEGSPELKQRISADLTVLKEHMLQQERTEMALKMLVPIAKRLYHNEQFIEHLFALKKVPGSPPSKTVVDIMKPAACENQPTLQYLLYANMWQRRISNVPEDHSVMLPGIPLARRKKGSIPTVMVKVDAHMGKLIQRRKELKKCIEGMEATLPTHGPRIPQKAPHLWRPTAVKRSQESSLAVQLHPCVARPVAPMMLCKSYLKGMLELQWCAVPDVLIEQRSAI